MRWPSRLPKLQLVRNGALGYSLHAMDGMSDKRTESHRRDTLHKRSVGEATCATAPTDCPDESLDLMVRNPAPLAAPPSSPSGMSGTVTAGKP
jgi:hypothetical protein